MIPKIIHYCWFGGNSKSEIIQNCIASWKEYCPDYEIIEWNENNFDINCIPYVAKAYADKKWAFVSDYARLYVVYVNGGIYLDTDVLLHNNIDNLLDYSCWLASDDVRYMATGLGFGAEKHNSLVKAIMNEYLEYEYPSGTNVTRDSKVIERELPQWKKSDRSQVVDNTLLIGLKDYSKYATHLYTYTWSDEETIQKREKEIKENHTEKLSVQIMWKIKCLCRNPKLISFFDRRRGSILNKVYIFCAYDLLDCGIWYFVKRLGLKIFKALGGHNNGLN